MLSSESSSEEPFGFTSEPANKVFDSLVESFIEDYMTKKYFIEKSGWRTLPEIAKKTHLSHSLLYGKHSLDEPIRRGCIETRIFPGERGRGGKVLRLRIAYEKEPIREYVNDRVKFGRKPSERPTNIQLLARHNDELEALDRTRIAVLPFTSISLDSNDEYFADGITEELISTISKISGFQVIARTSVLPYKGGGKRVDEIARELKVGTILEGSVRKAGQRVRVTAQLINSEDNRHLWSETYNRELKDIFAIQTDISQTVAKSLRVKLLEKEKERIRREPTKSTEAYVLYLKGRRALHARAKEGMRKAVDYFEKAIKLDQKFALAYSGLADAHFLLGDYGHFTQTNEWLGKAEAAARKALEIDENLAEAHASLSAILFRNYDITSAEEECRRAIALDHSYAQAHLWYGIDLAILGRFDEALDELRTTLRLDPVSFLSELYVAHISAFKGEYDIAIEQYQDLIKHYESKSSIIYSDIGISYYLKGNYEMAIEQITKAVELSSREDKEFLETTSMLYLAMIYAKMGKLKESVKIVSEIEEKIKSGTIPKEICNKVVTIIAAAYTALGNKDEAFCWLQKACDEHEGEAFALKVNPIFNELRSDKRFFELLKKLGLISPVETLN